MGQFIIRLCIASISTVSLLSAMSGAGRAESVPLNPLDFTSLGAFPTEIDDYQFFTGSGSAPLLMGSSYNVVATGVYYDGIAVFDFNSIDVASFQTFRVGGGGGGAPLALLSRSAATIAGYINAGGPFAFVGQPQPNPGFGGGMGGLPANEGGSSVGGGPGGGLPGGGGGGFGGAGGVSSTGTTGGKSYSNLGFQMLGGSGGGAGGGENATGGGGGGAIEIGAVGAISISGRIVSDGGDGGAGGGGGSGGAISCTPRL